MAARQRINTVVAARRDNPRHNRITHIRIRCLSDILRAVRDDRGLNVIHRHRKRTRVAVAATVQCYIYYFGDTYRERTLLTVGLETDNSAVVARTWIGPRGLTVALVYLVIDCNVLWTTRDNRVLIVRYRYREHALFRIARTVSGRIGHRRDADYKRIATVMCAA